MSKEAGLSYIVVWYSLAVCATVFFLYGYFPVKSGGTYKLQDPPSIIEGIKVDAIKSYKPIIDRLIIVVIDGIRLDFVKKEHMPLLMTELNKWDGCVIKVHVEAPTVTMPRLKAITTGSVPQYIDIALNLGSKQLVEDSFLHRLKDMNKPIVFYGDNTWNNLFSDIFLRSEGVNSFYVNDFVEVDGNVTRNLDYELSQKDWKLMILHYLGLDHIGHVHGPYSELIDAKLSEMDQIIQHISLKFKHLNNTAILVTGDHGMRDSGGHGGTSQPEVMVPFAWIGSCPRKILSLSRAYEKQTDIAVTLSSLMGLTFPADSVGTLMSQLFDDKDADALLYKYYYNAKTLIEKKKKHNKYFKNCFNLHKEFLAESKNAKEAIDCYEAKLREVSDKLVNEISRQIIPYLIISTVILFWCLLALALPSKHKLYLISVLIIISVFSIESFAFGTKFSIILSSILLSLCLINALSDFEKIIFSALNASTIEQIFGIGSIIGTLCWVSSSFVEEEHQIWLFFLGTFIFCNVFKFDDEKRVNLKWIVSFVFLRFLRNLNKVGDQNSYVSDLSDWLDKEANTDFLKAFFIVGLLGTFLCIFLHSNGNKKSLLVSLTTMILIYIYKMYDENHLIPLFWSCVVLYVIFERKNLKNALPCIWMQIISLYMRPWNVILISGFYISSQNILKYSPSLFIKVMAHLWLIKVFFNGQGNDNSIGSIDISPGYIGFSDYYPVFVGIQIFFHYYAFFILGYMLVLTNFKTTRERVQMFRICTIYKLFDILYFCFVTIIHRNHLFIWSVFAPKLIVEAAHTTLLLIILYSYSIIKSF